MRKNLLLISLVLLGAILLSSCSTAARGTSWPGLTASGDVAYLADGTLVYAVNLKDGKELWHYPDKADTKKVFYSTPVITSDGLVIVGSSGTDHSLVAINPKDINPQTKSPNAAWTFSAAEDHWVATPLIINNLLFAPNSDGNLYVLDLSDGQSEKQAVKKILLVDPNSTDKKPGRLWGTPVTDGKRIYVTSLDHSVFGVDLETYEYWHEDLSGAVPGSPVIGADGNIYVGTLAAELDKLDPATGVHEAVLKLDAKGLIWSTPVVDGDSLLFGDLAGNFYSFNTTTGKLNGDAVQPDGPVTATPLLLGDNALVATEAGSIFEIGKDGRSKLWSQPGGNIYTTPVLAGDLVLVAPMGAKEYLYAYNQDGSVAWPPFIPGK